LVKDFICVYQRASAAKKVVEFQRSRRWNRC